MNDRRSERSARLRFGHFLETGSPGWEERAKRFGIDPEHRDALIAEFSGNILPIGTEVSAIVAILGTPDETEHSTMRYDLGVRSDYLYEFTFNEETQTVIDSDYVHRHPRHLELRLPQHPKQALAVRTEMIRLGVTAKELRAAFGEPPDRIGWWPCETWVYPGLSLELRLGVVEVVG